MIATPRAETLDINGIPDELTEWRQWIGWRKEERGDKPTKVPVNPRTGRLASVTVPATWATLNDVEACPNIDGVGFVLTADDPYCVIDLDNCIDPETGATEPWALKIVDQLDSFTEISPSGRGLHIWIKGTLPPGRRRTGQIEIYDSERYLTCTGWLHPARYDTFDPYDIQNRQQELDQLHRELFPPEPTRTPASNEIPRTPNSLGDDELLHRAKNARNGAKFQRLWDGDTSDYGGDHSAADEALCNHLAFWAGPDPARIDHLFRQSGLYRKKWDRADYRERTITKALTGRGDYWQGERPQPTPITSAAASEPDSPDIATLRAEIEQLRQENAEWKARYQRLKDEQLLMLQVLRNPGTKDVAMTALSVIYEVESAQSRGADEDGKVLIYRDQVAENSGCSPTSVSNHLKRLSEYGVLDRHVSRGLRERVDQETGEITREPVSELRVELRDSREGILRKLAEIKPKRSPNWGGRRLRCPHHPTADINVTRIYSCSECGMELDRDYDSRPPDPPNPDEIPEYKSCKTEDTSPSVEERINHDNSCKTSGTVPLESPRNSSLVGRDQKIISIHERRACVDCGQPCGTAERCSSCAAQATRSRGNS